MKALHSILLLLAFAFPAFSEESALKRELTRQLATLDGALAAAPDSTRLLSSRGDTHLFLGHFQEAVADYEQMIALDPSLDAPHWRLGIAYHFARQWEKSSRQFAKYHAYDSHDRENGVWKFLADVQWHDLPTARREMLPYTAFDREPFPALYDLLAGRITASEFQRHLEAKHFGANRPAMFYAHYYRGLLEDLVGEREQALVHLRAAVELFSPDEAMNGGPGYMWHCARLHLAQLIERP